MNDFDPIDALSAVFGPLRPVFGGDAYANVQPEDLPPLPELTDEEAAEMADRWEQELSDDDGMTDAEADADTLRMAGMGTDEDYGGMIGGDSDLLGEF